MKKSGDVDTSINWAHFFGGGIGGTVGAVLTCPLEVVKTRLQSSDYRRRELDLLKSTRPQQTTLAARLAQPVQMTFGVVHKVYTAEGIAGLFRGIGPNLVGVIPSRAISFATYGNAKRIYTELNGHHETALIHLSAAATAGVVTATATNPIWLVKTRMQLQSSQHGDGSRYRNSLHCLYRVAREEGLRGLYKGLSASYLGVTESAIQWVIYEQLKVMIRERKTRRLEALGNTTTATTIHNPTRTSKDWMEYFGAAGSAKLLAAVITYPHEVLRTRLRQAPPGGVGAAPYKGIVDCFTTILRYEGVTALYGGMTAHLLRTVPNAAIMFFCYEFVVQKFSPE
ncbi:Pyrimidine nucleotide transporter, mitochondrial [Tieghemiomyces parasiticus]|uniref:Pyrimidine nucleotide transporter, mitochondrial n=1 Tax=Tieghemiomyces parasiticus TaxID=78921 RepID=A0A9W8A4N5_9FUNG|nr:Pyrimidine nucleotide transporter, mitochondrial [Tieghemiomyces parasiticus]